MTENKKKLIIVSTFFPPIQHIATNRILAYAKYLSEHYNIEVVTIGDKDKSDEIQLENGFPCKIWYLSNTGFWAELLTYSGRESKVFRTIKTIIRLFFNNLSISYFRTWRKKAEKKIIDLLQDDNVKVVLSSYAPDDTLEASYQALIKTKRYNVKWVIDFRDEYSEEKNISFLLKKIRQSRESAYSIRADLAIAVSIPQLEILKHCMPNTKGFIKVMNGFDHDFMFDYKKTDEFKIGYFGSFYGKMKPDSFFAALERWGLNRPIRVYIATKNLNFSIPDSIKRKVVILPYMSQADSIKKMFEMDCNLLILPTSNRIGVYSGKLFDYISVFRSIIALVDPKDVAAKLIEELDCGYVAPMESIEKIQLVLDQAFKDWQNNSLKVPYKEQVNIFHRKKQVQKLVTKLIDY